RLDLEGDGVPLADVDDAGVLTDAGQHLPGRRLLRDLAELAQVDLGRLVRAVHAPHHRVHRQLAAGRPPVQDVPDPLVLIRLQAELGPRLLDVRGATGVADGVGGHVRTPALGGTQVKR